MTKDLKEAFSKENLIRCWTWLNSNGDNNYKYYYRSLYKAYTLSLDENSDKLHRDLIQSRYRPEHSTKLYIPKKSGILRPYSLLNLNDQVVYLALVSIIAERLVKRAKKNYYKRVFGHLYAGRVTPFFYKRWTYGYMRYNQAINKSFLEGFKWTASFDLTAFYDSIDHKVLSYFLLELGLTKEFTIYLTDCLEVWTASTSNRIYHGHGIPQGPLPSGLLSEVILQHFDEQKLFNKPSIKYYRYVDDIRLMGKSEEDVRRALLELDYVSKEVGLFPQSSKINIHEISDIDEEIKTVSLPPEPIDFNENFDQLDVKNRIDELAKDGAIENETRFKYVLAHAAPDEKLANKLLYILKKNPHLYQTILKHFSKYNKFSKTISKKMLLQLNQEQLYEEITSAYLIISLGKIHKSIRNDFSAYCIRLHLKRKHINSPNLRSIVFVWLLNENYFKYREIENIYKSKEWWLIHNSLEFIDVDLFGEPSYQGILNVLLKSESFEVAIKAAFLIVRHNFSITVPINTIHDAAQIILKKAKIIGRTSLSLSNINRRLEEVCGTKLPAFNWKRFLGTEQINCERIAYLLTGYIKTDANAFINELDVFNDLIINALYLKNTALGSYKLGNIGSCLTPTGRFASGYPKFFWLCNKIHELRLESALSHPIVKRTGKPTRQIKFKEIEKLKPQIYAGYKELIALIA